MRRKKRRKGRRRGRIWKDILNLLFHKQKENLQGKGSYTSLLIYNLHNIGIPCTLSVHGLPIGMILSNYLVFWATVHFQDMKYYGRASHPLQTLQISKTICKPRIQCLIYYITSHRENYIKTCLRYIQSISLKGLEVSCLQRWQCPTYKDTLKTLI